MRLIFLMNRANHFELTFGTKISLSFDFQLKNVIYGSWIYNYLCNQYLSPRMLCVRISIRARCTTLCCKVWQGLMAGLWFSPGPPVPPTQEVNTL